MPELPELEVIREVLAHEILAQEIASVEVLPPGGPIVVRDLTQSGFAEGIEGRHIEQIWRRSKFLIFHLQPAAPAAYLAINFKLTGRLRLAEPGARRKARTCLIFRLAGGRELHYLDTKKMGQVYLTPDLERVPGFAGQGPEPLEMDLETFRKLIRPLRGEVKAALTAGKLVAGIGNAYADEILWEARLHPYRKLSECSPEEIDGLYMAMRKTLTESIDQVRDAMQGRIETEPRQFMGVHMKTDLPCPRCGSPISLVSAGQRITNFCRTCQPGGLLRGMG